MEALKFVGRLVLFLVLNFVSLFVGGLLMRGGPSSSWYKALKTAPWSPPGWVFAAAWTTIAVTYSLYMAILVTRANWRWYLPLFLAQLILNPAWCAVFFGNQMFGAGLGLIILDWLVIVATALLFLKPMRYWSFLMVPYVVWLSIATSLNAYVVAKN